MFRTQEAKLISDFLRRENRRVRRPVQQAFHESILNANGEVDFFRRLLTSLNRRLHGLNIAGVMITCRVTEIHQKPIVHTPFGRCELGDLLVVVKYKWLSRSLERKSIIYQVKLSQRDSSACGIAPIQLELLSRWPTFQFGRSASGYTSYSIQPKSLELGSYMLEPRNPSSDYRLRYGCYGVCPYAESVRSQGLSTVNIEDFDYIRGDVSNFFSHIAFEIGEHQNNREVKKLVDALYRFVGLEPDPPHEFDKFTTEETEDAAFGILEITVTATGDSDVVRVFNSDLEKKRLYETMHKDKNAA